MLNILATGKLCSAKQRETCEVRSTLVHGTGTGDQQVDLTVVGLA